MPKEVVDPVLEANMKRDKRFCGTLCLCQMIAVLSAVSMVYLTVAIYAPSSRALDSGISETPIMCQTVLNEFVDACEWSTCGEWCLSKSSGACSQVHVRARNNGSTIRLNNCTDMFDRYCEVLEMEKQESFKCKNDSCKHLTGQFNCTEGTCYNYTSVLQCNFVNAEEPLNCRRQPRQCRDINGLMDCVKGVCREIKKPFNCERRCIDIPVESRNVILIMGDHIFLANCKSVSKVIEIEDEDEEEGIEEEIWTDDQKTLLASCWRINNSTNNSFYIEDCVNGTLLDTAGRLDDRTNYTTLMRTHYENYDNPLMARDSKDENPIPLESTLMIYNKTQLMINMEGCVNTLRDECAGYLKEFGKDGRTHAAAARFPCFYTKLTSEFVVSRFSRADVIMELMIAAILPVSLFVVSCFTLVMCTKSVVITEEGHYRCKYCGDTEMDTVTDSTGERAMAL